MILHFIMPVTRPLNVERVYNSILTSCGMSGLPWHLWCVFDKCGPSYNPRLIEMRYDFAFMDEGDDFSGFGNDLKNQALNFIPAIPRFNNYVAFVDDNTIVHPDFIESIMPHLDRSEPGVLYQQAYRDGSIRKGAGMFIDKPYLESAQIVCRRELLNGLEFSPAGHSSDMVFVQKLMALHGKSFVVLDKPLCYYQFQERAYASVAGEVT